MTMAVNGRLSLFHATALLLPISFELPGLGSKGDGMAVLSVVAPAPCA